MTQTQSPEKSIKIDILIIDQNPLVLDTLYQACKSEGLTVMTANQMPYAMESLIYYSPKVVITELIRSEERGVEFLRALRRIRSESIIIIHSDKTNVNEEYKKKLGLIFAFLKKPAEKDELILTIRRALEFYEFKKKSMNYSVGSEEKMKEQLEWLIWKEQRVLNSKSSFGKTIIETIVHSIFQGMGVGSLVSLIDLMEMTMKEDLDNNAFLVKKEIIKSILDNSLPIRNIKENLDHILKVYEKDYPIEMIHPERVQVHIQNALEDVEDLRSIKNHKIILDDLRLNKAILANGDLLELSMRELLTNAFKYSPEEAEIQISRFYSPTGLSIVVVNPAAKVSRGINGIPPELEYEIFEPFFKINHIYDERYYKEELGFGIGLSYLQSSITRLGGNIHVNEVLDHLSIPPAKKIVAEIIFPFV
ncbi:MAG: response regulator [Leptospiraceae bacterium]|nr:response regulator [Leptospiraceae bacterium]